VGIVLVKNTFSGYCRQPDAAELRRLRSWTFPAYRHLLDLSPSVRHPGRGDRRPIRPAVFASFTEDHQPTGLLLGCVPNGPTPREIEIANEPELLSIYVAPMFRRQGIASLLLQCLETWTRKAGFRQLTTTYMTNGVETTYLENLLANHLWSTPDLRMRVYKGTLEQFMLAPWYMKYHPKHFEFVPWFDIDPKHIEDLERSRESTTWIPSDLTPWSYDLAAADGATSLGIYFKGAIVGWIITHRVSDDTLRLTCGFIRADLGRLGRILPALSATLQRACNNGFRHLMFGVAVHHPEMMRFADRWMKPWLSVCAETRGCVKNLPE
jgi:GNAT superfamily N-acetyltransferase